MIQHKNNYHSLFVSVPLKVIKEYSEGIINNDNIQYIKYETLENMYNEYKETKQCTVTCSHPQLRILNSL